MLLWFVQSCAVVLEGRRVRCCRVARSPCSLHPSIPLLLVRIATTPPAKMQDPLHVITNCYNPRETVEQAGRSGVIKANMRIDKMFISSVVAGMLLAFACAVSLSTQTAPWYQENAPGLIRMIGAVIFPFGLVMIVVTGVDLCTGSFMVCSWRRRNGFEREG